LNVLQQIPDHYHQFLREFLNQEELEHIADDATAASSLALRSTPYDQAEPSEHSAFNTDSRQIFEGQLTTAQINYLANLLSTMFCIDCVSRKNAVMREVNPAAEGEGSAARPVALL
jgi:hypothetical protein